MEDDSLPYYEDEGGWGPPPLQGIRRRQRTPNMIRNEFRRYVDRAGVTGAAMQRIHRRERRFVLEIHGSEELRGPAVCGPGVTRTGRPPAS